MCVGELILYYSICMEAIYVVFVKCMGLGEEGCENVLGLVLKYGGCVVLLLILIDRMRVGGGGGSSYRISTWRTVHHSTVQHFQAMLGGQEGGVANGLIRL